MAWEYGNADVDWMDMPIGNYGDRFGTTLSNQQPVTAQTEPTTWGLNAEDWRNIQYLTGALGQAALKGTNMEWLGNMGGVTAQMAKNAQVSARNKEYQQLLQNINNPNVKDVTITEKGDGTKTVKFGGTATDPMQQMLMTQPGRQDQATPAANALKAKSMGMALSEGPSFFGGAQQPWWLRLGQ